MSLYKNTNEMFNNSSLYHSDEYLGEDYTDGIYHWKYIKREKKNGRWVYYYEDKKADALKNKYNKAYIDNINSGAFQRNEKKIDINKLDRGNTLIRSSKKPGTLSVWSKKDALSLEKYSKAARKYRNHMSKTLPRRIAAKAAITTLNAASSAKQKGQQTISKILKNIKK